VLHPVDGAEGPTRWDAICSVTGRQAHALMQWDDIAGPDWSGGKPEQGNLAPDSLERLCGILAHHTPADAACFFAVWEGYGWGDTTPAGSISVSAKPPLVASVPQDIPSRLPPVVIDGPRLRLPHRSYFLFTGPLRAALATGEWATLSWFIAQSPNLFWPQDRSWCVASEIDFDSTVVGGSKDLVAGLLSAPGLEAWPVNAGDSLAAAGDEINGR
jgi:hypothetical protein